MTVERYLAKYTEVLADLYAAVNAVEPDSVKSMAIVEHIRQRFEGEIIYIPFGKKTNITIKPHHLEIYQKFNGNNHKSLAHEYGLSQCMIYAIVKAVPKKLQAIKGGFYNIYLMDFKPNAEHDGSQN